MKSKVLMLVLLLCSLFSFSQDTVRLKHASYTTVFSKTLYYPVLVEWWVTKAKVTCSNPVTRITSFYADPMLLTYSDLISDYKNSGFDRGHNSPSADNLCEGATVQKECFYFTNMTPQYHVLNAGDWKMLEDLTRTIAKNKDSIKVWCGSVGSQKKIGRVSVPTKCWKVIYIKKDKTYEAYIFDNNTNAQTGVASRKVTLDQVSKLTGFTFSAN